MTSGRLFLKGIQTTTASCCEALAFSPDLFDIEDDWSVSSSIIARCRYPYRYTIDQQLFASFHIQLAPLHGPNQYGAHVVGKLAKICALDFTSSLVNIPTYWGVTFLGFFMSQPLVMVYQ